MRKLFISDAHEDADMCHELRKQLNILERAGVIELWADREIKAGDSWRERILTALDEAHVALFLVSANMFWSDFICREELPRACRRAAAGELLIIPVILKPCCW